MSIRKPALWTSIILTTILAVWCLLVPYWHIYDSSGAHRLICSERRAVWRQHDPNASVDVTFTLVPAAAFLIVAIVLGFSLRDSATAPPAASEPANQPGLKK